jgi:predicted MPP superfamily phosphohydrolase
MRAAVSVGGCAAFDSFALEPNWLDISRHEVVVPGLPRHLVGFTIAQITDAHLTRLGNVEETIVTTVRDENVQLVALTGDIIDSVRRVPLLEEFCSALQGDSRTIVATLGNWEHWGHIPLRRLRESYARSGAQLMVNEFRVLPDGIQLCATDDDTGGQVELDRAIGKEGADAKILLTHSPGFLDSIPEDIGPFAVTLAGHTHGGQIRLASNLVPFVPPGSGRFVSGWYQLQMGAAYVSRGTGTSIVPARFACRPELPVYRLQRA